MEVLKDCKANFFYEGHQLIINDLDISANLIVGQSGN